VKSEKLEAKCEKKEGVFLIDFLLLAPDSLLLTSHFSLFSTLGTFLDNPQKKNSNGLWEA